MNPYLIKMNRLLITLTTSLIVIGNSLGSFAQDTNSLLWKVTGKELSKPSYLFGTIHMLPQDKYFFTEKMQEALTNSDVLALEVDMNVSVADQMKMASDVIMPDQKTWADYMTAEEYAAVKSAFVDSLGIKEKKVDKYAKLKPFYATSYILLELVGKVKMYERELVSLAKKEKKEVIGLETLQEQMEIVSSIPVEEQIEDLKATTASLIRDYNEMLDAYLNQDLKALEQTTKENESFETIEAKLLTERNLRWVKSIAEMMQDNSYFFAVGAMHLVGETGLINQLKMAGYTVEPIK